MASKVLGKKIDLLVVYKENVFQLLGVSELFEYKNGERSNTKIGYTYEVVDLNDFDKIRIKIKGQQKPLLTNEELQTLRQNGERTFVEFENATIMPYWNGRSVEDSFSAENISLVETTK